MKLAMYTVVDNGNGYEGRARADGDKGSPEVSLTELGQASLHSNGWILSIGFIIL